MVLSRMKKHIARFRDDKSGVVVVEMVITLPLLVLALAATYEFFEVFRYKSIRDKATYTIADMISREGTTPGFIDNTYLDNCLRLFSDVAMDNTGNQIRISEITYNDATSEYEVEWSEIRGAGSLIRLVDSDVATTTTLPVMQGGDYLLLVESRSTYTPNFNVGFGNSIEINTRTFTKFRFLPKLDYIP
jgi:Flp pilus assembly protein TadG